MTGVAPQPLTVAGYAEAWLRRKRVYVKASTYARYRWIVERVIVPRCGTIGVEEFGNEELQDFAVAVAEYGYGTKSITAFLQCARQMMRDAELAGKKTAMRYDIRVPKAYDADTPLQPQTLPEADTRRLLDELIDIAANPAAHAVSKRERRRDAATLDYDRRYALGCLLGLCCGLRIGETCGMRRDDIDFPAGTLEVSRTVFSYVDDGREVCGVGPPKTKNAYRTVPVPSRALVALEEHAPDGYLIPGGDMRRDVPSKRGLAEWFRSLLAAMGIKRITFHGLRHTYATRLLDAGANVKAVSELLGHSDVAITLRIYSHPDEAAKRATVEVVEW